MDKNKIKIVNVEPNDENCKIILNWRNDPNTRMNSFNQDIKTWDSFKSEFYNNYFKNIPLFISCSDKKIAFVSLTKNSPEVITVGINIDPDYRGQGLSKPIILKVIEYIKLHLKDIDIILAEIKEFNIASIKLFSGVGFTFLDERKLNESVLIKRYIYSIKSQDNGVPLDISFLATKLSTLS